MPSETEFCQPRLDITTRVHFKQTTGGRVRSSDKCSLPLDNLPTFSYSRRHLEGCQDRVEGRSNVFTYPGKISQDIKCRVRMWHRGEESRGEAW
jgi:hypothetical protein